MGGIYPRQEAGSLHLLARSLSRFLFLSLSLWLPGVRREKRVGTNAITPHGGGGEDNGRSKVSPQAPLLMHETLRTQNEKCVLRYG